MLNYLKIRKSSIYILLLFISFLTFTSCKDVFETNIENKNIKLLSPKDSLFTTSNLVFFTWETLEGAEKYNIQIVSNSFLNPFQYICDSNVTTNSISYILPAGTYQWRVKGVNFAYSTNFSIRTFTISLSNDITSIIPQLTNPVYGDTSNISSYLFKWNTIAYATNYQFELWKGKVSTGVKVYSVVLDTNILQYTLPSEAYYEWQVRGQNGSSNTPFSISPLLCDTTRPTQPTIIFPQNNTIVSDSLISLQWSRTNISGSVEYDSLLVFSDSLMNNTIGAYKIFTKSFSTKYYIGNYWWIIKPYDKAGNFGKPSILSKFRIQY